MPFLLAEILNYQGSAHLIGVGSLSKVVLQDSQLILKRQYEYLMFTHYDVARKVINGRSYICMLNDGDQFDGPYDRDILVAHYEKGKITIDLSLSNPLYSQAGHWGIYNGRSYYLHATGISVNEENIPVVNWEINGETNDELDDLIEEIYHYSIGIDPDGRQNADNKVSKRLIKFGLVRDEDKEMEERRWRLLSSCFDESLITFEFLESIDVIGDHIYLGAHYYEYELTVGE